MFLFSVCVCVSHLLTPRPSLLQLAPSLQFGKSLLISIQNATKTRPSIHTGKSVAPLPLLSRTARPAFTSPRIIASFSEPVPGPRYLGKVERSSCKRMTDTRESSPSREASPSSDEESLLTLQIQAFLEASEDVDIDQETVEDLMRVLSDHQNGGEERAADVEVAAAEIPTATLLNECQPDESSSEGNLSNCFIIFTAVHAS